MEKQVPTQNTDIGVYLLLKKETQTYVLLPRKRALQFCEKNNINTENNIIDPKKLKELDHLFAFSCIKDGLRLFTKIQKKLNLSVRTIR